MKAPRGVRALELAFALLALSVVAVTFGDYGINWDESVQQGYGERVAAWLASHGRDRSVLNFHDTRYYGPGFELLAVGVERLVHADVYDVRHACVALLALLALFAVHRIGRHLGHPLVPLLAAAALGSMPRFYGDAFHNSKDIPFACGVAFTIAGGLANVAAKCALGTTLALGTALGLTLSVRSGGLPILGLLLIVVHAVGTRSAGIARASLLRSALLVFVLGWLLMIAVWPFAWQDPLANPVLSMVTAFNFPATYPVLFEGHVYPSDQLPRTYLAKFTLLTVPLPLLVLAVLGLWLCVKRVRSSSGAACAAHVVLPCWLLLPYLLAALARPNVSDGMRHVLFTLPALALLAALGAAACYDALALRSRALAVVALLSVIASPWASLARLHPYEATYFNALAGGLRGAAGRYETEYYLLAYREAAEWIDAQAVRGGRRLKVLVAVDDYGAPCAGHFFSPAVAMTTVFHPSGGELPADYDYYLATTRYGFDRSFPGATVVYTVGREGARFAVVKGRATSGVSPKRLASEAFR